MNNELRPTKIMITLSSLHTDVSEKDFESLTRFIATAAELEYEYDDVIVDSFAFSDTIPSWIRVYGPDASEAIVRSQIPQWIDEWHEMQPEEES